MTTTRSTSSARTTLTPTPKLPDFTEDPFRNYRYADPSLFSDPFADDEDNNGNKNNNNQLDPFGFQITTTTTQNNDPFSSLGFESNFTNSYTTKNKNNFLNDPFKNSNNLEFVQQLSTTTTKPINKSINFDEAFSSNKNDKTNKKTDQSIAQVFKDKLGIKHGLQNKNKNNYNNNNNNNNNGNNGAWTGKNLTVSMNEQQQLAWAAQQSLKAEEERRRIKAQEDADLALALERSKHE